MKLLILLNGGRTGTDFFQSLLDGHEEILQFPGTFYFDELWNEVSQSNSIDRILEHFFEKYEKFFDSRINAEIERHDQLGKNKNEFYLFDKEIFAKIFKKLSENADFSKKNIITNLHLAYGETCNQNNNKKQIIVLQLQHLHRLDAIDDLDFEIIYTLRDPFVNLSSIINSWTKYNGGKDFVPQNLNFQIDRVINGLNDALKFGKKIHVIKLENLHQNNYLVMSSFCEKFNIKYNKTMTESTCHNKKWWGDKLSGRYLNGINVNYVGKVDFDFFYKKDISVIEECILDQLKFYNYKRRSDKKLINFFRYLPFKFEIKIWMLAVINLNIRATISILPSWWKRVAIFNKRSNANMLLPTSLGEKNQIKSQDL